MIATGSALAFGVCGFCLGVAAGLAVVFVLSIVGAILKRAGEPSPRWKGSNPPANRPRPVVPPPPPPKRPAELVVEIAFSPEENRSSLGRL